MIPEMSKVDRFGGHIGDRISRIWSLDIWNERDGR